MKIKIKKKSTLQMGKWHFKFGLTPVYWRTRGYMFHFGIFKLTSLPPEGEMFSKKNYKGFWFRKEFDEWSGFEINL